MEEVKYDVSNLDTKIHQKLNEYLKLDFTERSSRLLDTVYQNGGAIAGGAILSAIHDTPINDLDVYIDDKKTYHKMILKMGELLNLDKIYDESSPVISHINLFNTQSEYTDSFFMKNNILCRCQIISIRQGNKKIKIDLVLCAVSKEAVINNFDLSFCSVWYDSRRHLQGNIEQAISKTGVLNTDYLKYFIDGNTFIHNRLKKYRYAGYKIKIPNISDAQLNAIQDYYITPQNYWQRNTIRKSEKRRLNFDKRTYGLRKILKNIDWRELAHLHIATQDERSPYVVFDALGDVEKFCELNGKGEPLIPLIFIFDSICRIGVQFYNYIKNAYGIPKQKKEHISYLFHPQYIFRDIEYLMTYYNIDDYYNDIIIPMDEPSKRQNYSTLVFMIVFMRGFNMPSTDAELYKNYLKLIFPHMTTSHHKENIKNLITLLHKHNIQSHLEFKLLDNNSSLSNYVNGFIGGIGLLFAIFNLSWVDFTVKTLLINKLLKGLFIHNTCSSEIAPIIDVDVATFKSKSFVDFESLEEYTVERYYKEHPTNIIFIYDDKPYGTNMNTLLDKISIKNIIFKCNKHIELAASSFNDLDMPLTPYVRLPITPSGLDTITLDCLNKIIYLFEKEKVRVFVLGGESDMTAINYSAMIDSVMIEQGKNVFSKKLNLVSSSHCNDGTNMRAWTHIWYIPADRTPSCSLM